MATATRTVAAITADLVEAQREHDASSAQLLARRVVALQDELSAARALAAEENAEAKQRAEKQREAQLRTVLATLVRERSQAVVQAGHTHAADDVERAFVLDGQVVAITNDLATLTNSPGEANFGASTVRDDLRELRQVPGLRQFFFRNPTERRPAVDRSRWAALLPAAV